MSTTFSPRACPPDAWRTWLKEGYAILLRSVHGWLPLQIALLAGVVFVFPTHDIGLGVLILFLLLCPIWGVQLSLAEAMAQGNVSFSETFKVITTDLRDNGWVYIRAMGYRLLSVFVLVFLSYLLTKAIPHTPSSSTPSHDVPLSPLAAALHGWSFLWFFSQIYRFGGANGFHPQLSWKMRFSFFECVSLDARAFNLNRKSLWCLTFTLIGLFFIARFFPLLLPLVEIFWAGIMRSAFADIYDQDSGLKSVKKATVKSSMALPSAV